MDFRVAPQAESDLDDMWYFVATESSNIDVADRVLNRSPPGSHSLPANRTSVVGAMKTCGQASAVSWSGST